jgi:hypothetical protein
MVSVRLLGFIHGVTSSLSPPMITVPGTFRVMPRWWHDHRGRAWLDALPVLVASQCRRWDLQVDGDPLHGSNALVVPRPSPRHRIGTPPVAAG